MTKTNPNKQRSLANEIWYRALQTLVMCAWVLGWRIRYGGSKNIPRTGGVLVISNHQSHLDPPLVGAGCVRRMNYMARDTLFSFAPFRWLINSLDAIPIDRDGIGLAGIKESLRRLKRGELVVIFPEGTRTRDGRIAPFRPGFGTLAARSGAAILPVAIEGAFACWPRWQKLPRPGIIHVEYGLPILPEEVRRYSESELVAEVERRVRALHAEIANRPVFRQP